MRDVSGVRVVTPDDPSLAQFYEIQHRVVEHHGGNMEIGRELKGLLHQVGITQIESSASCGFEGTTEAVAQRAEIFASRVESAPLFRKAVELGWVDQAGLVRMADAWREWTRQPEAFLSTMFIEAVGWKE